jgi:hypothetical protein
MGCDTACKVENHYVEPGVCNMARHKHEANKCFQYNNACQQQTEQAKGGKELLEAAYCTDTAPCKQLTECLKEAYEASQCLDTDHGIGWRRFNSMMAGICNGKAFDDKNQPVCVENCYLSYRADAGLQEGDPNTCALYEDYIFGQHCGSQREDMYEAHKNEAYSHFHDGVEHKHKHHGWETDGEGVYHSHPQSENDPWRDL